MVTVLMLVSVVCHVGMCLYAVWLAWRLQDALEANEWLQIAVKDNRTFAEWRKRNLKAVVDAARSVIVRHDKGDLDLTPGNSVAVENLRQICDTIEEG